ncbi:bifunctional [glutamate--ammonia ligase]-adenylyl-L-tyrosine phosphorylase/[glutamate--ammonia-ligase] adenylyltransferase [Ampullimonas aquatilis]|uniref:bifunctional [glutamate--ammonia ligase]-adenylyl-L-tyrosine phosphorylase/[glutamate--ammonia-ligase] adenylyltransferase n=1 Tax=Ampullimonas aquatilis TaxID=1341549 RepID=UPI003C77FFD8
MNSTKPELLLAPIFSRYAARRLQAEPTLITELPDWLVQACSRTSMEHYLAQACGLDTIHSPHFLKLDESLLKSAFRRLRIRVLLSLMEKDLQDSTSLDAIMLGMSQLADLTIQLAAYWSYGQLATRFGIPCNEDGLAQSFMVLGMGKLGGCELNVSSDIDLIFLYPEDGETRLLSSPSNPGALTDKPSLFTNLSNHEFFVRLGKRVISLLSEMTADGFVFRVDMMLRPHGKSGPLAISFAALEDYLTVSGREWERYAWMKARVITTALASANAPVYLPMPSVVAQFEELINPFIYRRYLDFGAIAALRSMHGQIRRDAETKQAGRPERQRNVKLGPGGIREIEFIAQVFQLIRGGKEPQLRQRITLDILQTEASLHLLEHETVTTLTQAYIFLRQLEHRIQYLDDAQTHSLPTDSGDLLKIAQSMGFRKVTDFEVQLSQHQQAVAHIFASIFSDKLNLGPVIEQADTQIKVDLNDQASLEQLITTHASVFADPAIVLEQLKNLANSTRYTALNETLQLRYNGLLSLAFERMIRLHQQSNQIVAQATHPTDEAHHLLLDQLLLRFLKLLETIGRRQAYIALLAEYPQALDRVLDILQASGWAAQYLTSHPQLLDELLQPGFLYASANIGEFCQTLQRKLAANTDSPERQIDILREEHHAQVFRILAQDLSKTLTVERLSDLLSELADSMLQITINTLWQQLAPKDEPMHFAIIAYGKLGGKELGYASDLDLIFLYDPAGADPDTFDPTRYLRLAQRLITWLSSHTAAGRLFEIDTALRPNGRNGMLVTSLEAFRRYQLREGDNAAWIWEHQALTRARFCAGDTSIGRQFELIRHTVLCAERDSAALACEVVKMRQRVMDGHPNQSQLFDLKHDRGGMVDIEFIVQYLVLAHARQHTELTANLGNIALLGLAAQCTLIDASLATQVQDAYRLYRQLQHAVRLEGADRARVANAVIEAPRTAVIALWQQVLGTDEKPEHDSTPST